MSSDLEARKREKAFRFRPLIYELQRRKSRAVELKALVVSMRANDKLCAAALTVPLTQHNFRRLHFCVRVYFYVCDSCFIIAFF